MNKDYSNFVYPPTSVEFVGMLDTLYTLGISPKSSGFIYLIIFLMMNSVDGMSKTTYTETIEKIAEKLHVKPRNVIDNMTLTLNNAWNRLDVRMLFIELFKKFDGTVPKKRPKIRKMILMLMLICEVRNAEKDDIYADFFGSCLRRGMEVDL